MAFLDTLNDKNLLTEFGLIIQTGTAELLSFPERKEPLQNEWAESNGAEYDLDVPVFKDKSVTLKCAILADSDVDFWHYYGNLFAELSKPGFQKLFINDHSAVYKTFYQKAGTIQKTTKRLKNVEKILVKFDLILQIDNFIEQLEVWGRNLFLNSKIELSGNSYRVAAFTSSKNLKEGDEMTISIYGSLIKTGGFNIYLNNGNTYVGSVDFVMGNLYVGTFKVPSGIINNIIAFYFQGTSVPGDAWTFQSAKLEVGNKATEYSKAPEDLSK